MQSTFIQCQPDIMGGTPVFSGSRVPVHTLVEYLQAGETIDDFLEGFPTVERSKVLAFLEAAERYASLADLRLLLPRLLPAIEQSMAGQVVLVS